MACAELAPDRAARRVGWQPDDPVGHVGDLHGNGNRRRARWPRLPCRHRRSRPRPRSLADIRATAARAVPARFGSPSCIRPASSRLCQVASSAWPGPGCDRRVADGRAAARLRPPRWPAAPPAAAAVPGALTRAAVSSCSSPDRGGVVGQAEVHVHLVGDRGEDLQVGCATAGTASAGLNDPARPSQFTNVPAFSATAATGNTTSARSVTELTRSSRLTTNRAASSAASAAAGSGRSAGSTAADHQRLDVTAAPRRPGSARCPGRGRPAATRRPRPWPRRRGPPRHPSGGRRAAGWAARPPRSRRARRPAAGSRPAGPRSARASRAAADSAPGTSASRSPARMTAPGCAQRVGCRPARLVQAGRRWPAPSARRPRRPGTVGSRTPDILVSPRLASAAIEYTVSGAGADRLAQPQEHDRATRPRARSRPAARRAPAPGSA